MHICIINRGTKLVNHLKIPKSFTTAKQLFDMQFKPLPIFMLKKNHQAHISSLWDKKTFPDNTTLYIMLNKLYSDKNSETQKPLISHLRLMKTQLINHKNMILFIIYSNIFDDFLLFHGVSVMLYTEFCYVNIAYSVIHTCFFLL